MFTPRTLLFTILLVVLSACAPKFENPIVDAKASSADPKASSADAKTAPKAPPKTCQVTTPQDPVFVPPEPYPETPYEGYFWYGSNNLWTTVPHNGVWSELPHNPNGYTQKLPWWREGYSWTEEPKPELTVTGRRLDAPAPPFKYSDATNAYEPKVLSTMLIGVDIPTLGCWEITGRYDGKELSYVVWIGP